MIYDDIIVGAGSSGAVLAARLSEDPGRKVLLIEAGPDYPTIGQTPPSILTSPDWGTSHDWGFTAEMVPGRSTPYPRGKVTGGSSAVNATLALRGVPEDYDEWAAWGNDEWSWAKVLPYFCRLEDDPVGNPDFHGVGGPVPIRRRREEDRTPAQRALLDAFCALGFPFAADHNDPESSGVSPTASNRRDGQRISTAIAYLLPSRRRPNLTIRPECVVDRIVFDGSRAIGLEIDSQGSREIILGHRISLSAGAIGSPTILLRSGIGPAGDLRRLGIEPKFDRPAVGANLIDHAMISVALRTKDEVVNVAGPRQIWGCLLRYTTPGSIDRNDAQIIVLDSADPPRVTSFVACLMRPRSRGTLRLTDRYVAAAPEIRLNLASDPEDRRRLRESLPLLCDLVRSPLFVPYLSRTGVLADGRVLPIDDAVAVLASPEAIEAYIQQTVRHYVHPVGTARMGPDDDVDAVVDQYCRVRGVDNLRVVDASVMPNIPRANANLTCIMIGERVADWMRTE
jgi:choline dehydrogenase